MGVSDEQLLHFETARWNRAAILEKEIKAMKEEAENQRLEAGVAAWVREKRQDLLRMAGSHLESVTEISRKNVA